MPLIHSQRTIFDNIDFGEQGTEFLLQNVPTVLYKIVACKTKAEQIKSLESDLFLD